jgi:hypothetical protein
MLVSTFLTAVSSAEAAGMITYLDGRYVWGKGIVFVFDAPGYRNKDVRNANILWARATMTSVVQWTRIRNGSCVCWAAASRNTPGRQA